MHETKFENSVKVGDIVLVKNPAVKRQHWILGRILEIYPGADGKVRSVKLLRGKADYREKPGKPELHSLKHLYPLELSMTHDHASATPNSQEFLDQIEGEVVSELDFRESDDLPSNNLNESEESLLPSEVSEGISSSRVGGEDPLPADVNLPLVDVDHDPSPAFQNEYRNRAISRRSRPIRAPQRLLENEYLYFD